MTEDQICNLIETNAVTMLRLRDMAGNVLCDIEETTPNAAADELNKTLPNFREYGKLEILGRDDKQTNWTKSYTWKLEFPKSETKAVAVAAPSTGIGAIEYIAMMEKNMRENFLLQTQLLELKLKQDQNDPQKWAMIAKEFLPMFGYGTAVMNGGIQGPNKTLMMGDVKQNLSPDDINKAVGNGLENLAGKINGSQILRLINALNVMDNISSNIDKISVILEAACKNPNLLDTAITFLPKQ